MKNEGAKLCGTGYLCPFHPDGRYLLMDQAELKWPYSIVKWRKKRPAVKRTFIDSINRKIMALLG